MVMTPRPGRIARRIRIDAPEPRDEEFRTSADYAGYCRKVSHALAPSYGAARYERRETPPWHRRRPRARACAFVSCPVMRARGRHRWPGSSWCGSTTFRPTCCRRPAGRLQTLVADWAGAVAVAAGHAADHARGFCAAPRSAASRWRCCSTSRTWLEYSLFPYAVILQVTPVIAIAPLLLIYLPQQTAVRGLRLDRRVLSGAVQHHAGARIRSTAIWPACSSSMAPRRCRRCVI